MSKIIIQQDDSPTVVIQQDFAIPGPQGVPGPQGPTGSIGPIGPQGDPGAPGVGVPAGGTTGQALVKVDNSDYNTEWSTPASSGANTALSNLVSVAINQNLLPNANNALNIGSSALRWYKTNTSWVLSDAFTLTGTLTGDVTSGSDLVTNVTGDLEDFNTFYLVTGTGIPANTIAIRITANSFRLANFSGLPVNATDTNVGVTISYFSTSGLLLGTLAKPTTGASATIQLGTGRSVDNQSGTLNLRTGPSNRASGIASGFISLRTGDSTDDAGSATSGVIQIESGTVYGTGQSGSSLLLSGVSVNGGNTGNVSARTGQALGSGNSGIVFIRSGATNTGTTGQVQIATGDSSSAGTTGNVTITTGSTSGTRGSVDVNAQNITLNAAGDLVLNPVNIINASSKLISNVLDPVSNQDAATKFYVDTGLSGKQNIIDGLHGNNNVLGTNSTGFVQAVPGINVNSINGLNQSNTFEPDDVTGTATLYIKDINIEPIQDSPDETLNVEFVQVDFDNADSGFDFGTNGQAVRIRSVQANHAGSGDIGEIQFSSVNSNIGNGTDPINVKGIGVSYAFGTVNANVNLDGPLQGYGMQVNVNAAASIDSSTFISVFYDGNQINCASPNYQSSNFSPTILSFNNNTSYSGVNINPTIPTFTGNAGFIGVNINGNLGTFNDQGYYHGVNVNPTIASARYASGINVTMDNVTPFAGAASTLTVQDLTLTFIALTDNNNLTLEYTPGGTAGSEVVTLIGDAIEVQIDSGVSTATQVKAALDAVPAFVAAVTVTISGTASNAQVTFGPTNFSGGEFPGTVLAGYFDGDVQITGSLSFGGALSVGQLNAFSSNPIVNGGGQPTSIHSLVTNPTVEANVTVALGDTLGVNTAMLLTMGDNSVVTTGFIGVTALALPAVVTMGAGSTLDRASGAAFVLSLDAGATGGTITTLDLCRALAIPNGVTTVTNLYGYKMELPFGDPGTTSWGFYESPGVNNYFQGNLLIGGTAGSDDTVTNSSVALEIKSTTKAFRASTMDTTQRDALTALSGMIVFNTSTSKLQTYDGANWVDLH